MTPAELVGEVIITPILLIKEVRLREPKPKAPEEFSSESILQVHSPSHTTAGSLLSPHKDWDDEANAMSPWQHIARMPVD